MSSHSSSGHTTAALVKKLVCYMLNKSADSVKLEFRTALQVLSCSYNRPDIDELSVCEKIIKKFMLENKVKDALTFNELHRKLQTTSVLKYRASVLHFMYCLYGFDREDRPIDRSDDLCSFGCSDLDIALSSNDLIFKRGSKNLPSTLDLGDLLNNTDKELLASDELSLKGKLHGKDHISLSQNKNIVPEPTFAASFDKLIDSKQQREAMIERALSARSEQSNLGSINCGLSNLKLLLRDVLYCVQGLKGDIIYWEPEKGNFNVEFKKEFPAPVKKIVMRFLELGWMYCKINQYCISLSKERCLGLIAQSFIAALKQRLVEYYKLIAELEAFLNQDSVLDQMQNGSYALTLHRMSVWLFEPHTQLKILASVVDACNRKKGGALASVLYSHLQHGDQYVRTLIQNLLKDVTRPLFRMLSNWIYRGELEDAFGEFFVATNTSVPDSNLWQEKYSLNKAMLPSFITMKQAKKILSMGKAINFLHQVCQDNTFVRDEDQRIKALELLSIESLFSQEKDANFESILEKNYTKTSKTVLRVLHERYNLMDHLLAMRNYFLLGQGDFIRHLMDLLDADLDKPGKSLFIHDLSGILESAIRATNAQYHNPEVLQRLDVRLLEVSIGDTGWDVFSLDYHVDGPIGTVFTVGCMNSYLRLFSALWRAKRMEYILSKISHSRTTYLKLEAKLPEVMPVLHQCNIVLALMVHFVQQMQYYLAFEVMECCWADLLLKISSAQDLDEVIAAHENFLDTLLKRALLDEESLFIRTQLKSIYDFIIEFSKIQGKFWDEVRSAVQKLDEMNEVMEANSNKNKWGITEREKAGYYDLKNKLLSDGIPRTKASLRILSHSYEDMVQKFLIMLSDSSDANLHFLSFRLDFNEHFKCRNSLLQSSQTYQHRRKSLGVKK